MQKLAEYVVRPARRIYDPETDLGPSIFTVESKYYCHRTDFEVRNRRFKMLKCSLFHHHIEEGARYPLIVFCHGNSGNRTYSYEIVARILKAQMSVLTFDFAGCGLSEGKYVFQGFFEQYDIEDVLEDAVNRFPFIDQQKIGIWGRSMGAIAALLFTSHNHSASLIVLDSPIKDFSDIINEYLSRVKIIPNVVAEYILKNLRKRIMKLASFDIEELKPIQMVSTCQTPALFHHTNKDQVVPAQHSKDLFNKYPAEKYYLETEGGHNSPRLEEYYEYVLKFINKIFSRKRGLPEIGLLNYTSTLQPSKNMGELDNMEMNDSDIGMHSDELDQIIEQSNDENEKSIFENVNVNVTTNEHISKFGEHFNKHLAPHLERVGRQISEHVEEYVNEKDIDCDDLDDTSERNVEESLTESIDEEVDENMLVKVLGDFTHLEDDDDEEYIQQSQINFQKAQAEKSEFQNDSEKENHDDNEAEKENENENEKEIENEAEKELAEIYNSEFKMGEQYNFGSIENVEENKETHVNEKGFLLLNEKDDLFSRNGSPFLRTRTTPFKEQSPEFSKILSEPNLLEAVKPFRLFKVKSAQNSLFQEF